MVNFTRKERRQRKIAHNKAVSNQTHKTAPPSKFTDLFSQIYNTRTDGLCHSGTMVHSLYQFIKGN